MTHPFLMVWLLLMIRYEFVYVYFIATKNIGDYSYMSSPNIYYRAYKNAICKSKPRLIKLAYFTKMNVTLIGPCTPTTRTNSISAVLDGPEM